MARKTYTLVGGCSFTNVIKSGFRDLSRARVSFRFETIVTSSRVARRLRACLKGWVTGKVGSDRSVIVVCRSLNRAVDEVK